MPAIDLSGGGGGFGHQHDAFMMCCAANRSGSDSEEEPGGRLSTWSNLHMRNLLNFGPPKRFAQPDAATSSSGGVGVAPTPDISDEIAVALNQLSFKEREQVYHDIHGIPDSERDDEDPAKVQQCLAAMNEKLQQRVRQEILQSSFSSSSDVSSALRYAMEQNPDYVTDESFLLSFLRAEEWKPRDAFDRMVGFLEQKMDLFGVGKLTTDITIQNDFSQDDVDCLLSGGVQSVPLKDQSGRHILFLLPTLEHYREPKNLLRTLYYTVMAIAQGDAEAQRRGLVAVVYFVGLSGSGKQNDSFFQMRRRIQKLRSVLPIKMGAGHVCTDDPNIQFLIQFVKPFFNLHTLTRIKVHCGHHVEVQYELSSYGIPLPALPVNSSGQCSNKFQKIWLQRRLEIESARAAANARTATTSPTSVRSSSASPMQVDGGSPQLRPISPNSRIILQPESNDCILGRGRAIDQHAGNVQFRQFLQQEAVLKQYQNAPKYMKFAVAEPIQRTLEREYNVRFLSEHPSGRGWQLADDDAVRRKILRTFRRFITQQQQQQQQNERQVKPQQQQQQGDEDFLI